MTAAGVATLFTTQEDLTMGTSPSCKGNISDPNIEKGLAWIGDHFSDVFKGKYAYYASIRTGGDRRGQWAEIFREHGLVRPGSGFSGADAEG